MVTVHMRARDFKEGDDLLSTDARREKGTDAVISAAKKEKDILQVWPEGTKGIYLEGGKSVARFLSRAREAENHSSSKGEGEEERKLSFRDFLNPGTRQGFSNRKKGGGPHTSDISLVSLGLFG